MRITSLKIERFGVWEGLSLPKVSRGLNVFYGPNEAGKTTLTHFVRACLYGGADEERARYIQMALDGRRRRESPATGGANAVASAERSEERSAETFGTATTGAANGSDGGSRDSSATATVVRDLSRSWVGGSATVASDYGEYTLERRYIKRDADFRSALERKAGFVATNGGLADWSGRFYSLPGQKIAESLVITGPDGARVGDYFAKTLTCNLDEATYNAVFAIGLDELQRLGMLNETEAAQMLYRLSVGVDRGAFVQVFQQLVAERNDLFDAKGKPSILENLLAERDRARRKSGDAANDLREYTRLIEERRAVLEAVEALRDRIEKTTRQKRLREVAVQVEPIWDERETVRAEIAAAGDVAPVEQAAVDDCRALIALVDETKKEIEKLKETYRARRDERDAIPVDPALEELTPRVSILEGDLPRLREIDAEVKRLEGEIAELEGKLAEEEARVESARDGKLVLTPNALDAINANLVAAKLVPDARFSDSSAKARQRSQTGDALGANAPGSAPTLPNKLAEAGLSFKEVEDFRIPAKRVRRRRLAARAVREEFERVRAGLNELVDKLEKGLTSRSQKNLTEAIERTGALSTALRRRVEIERRVGEMTAYRKELERQNRTLADNQAITGPPLVALGAGVVVGGLLFGLALFGKIELAVGLIGLLATIGCLLYKTTVEKNNYRKLEENQRRLGLLTKQLEQARAEAKSLDERFPAPAGQAAAFDARLQKAKADLAFFESLAPVEAKWREATKAFRAEEARLAKAEESLKKARKRWRSWLREACLPTTLNPAQVRDILARVGLTEDFRRELDGLNAELDFLTRERKGIVDRFDAALALFPGFEVAGKTPFEIAPELRAATEKYAETQRRRAELLDETTALKKSYRKLFLERRRRSREVRKFLAGFRVETEKALVDAVARYAEFRRKSAELAAVQGRLDVGIGGFASEAEIGALLSDADERAALPTSIETLVKRLEGFDAELRGKLELSGRLGQQADALATKKGAVRTRFESAALDLRIARVAELWRSRAIAGRTMEDVRRAYERDRQPETLREASRYLRRLTDSRYVNIWTPLGDDSLFVDASNGETLDVASLSRGTREQLFIAIRLALVASFEKHGVQTPMALDDVLVNFDVARAATAAKLLRDFAAAGRQIFLFTCHEHICRLFLDLGVPVCALPTSNATGVRKFRVLLPPKMKRRAKAAERETNVSVDGAASEDAGPSFVEEAAPLAAAVPALDVGADVAKRASETLAEAFAANDFDNATSGDSTDSAAGSEPIDAPENGSESTSEAPSGKTPKPYIVVEGSDDAPGVRLSDEAEAIDPNDPGDERCVSVGRDSSKKPESASVAGANADANGSAVDAPNGESDSTDAQGWVEATPNADFSDVVLSTETIVAPRLGTLDPVADETSNASTSGFPFPGDDEPVAETENFAAVAEYVETLKNAASLDGESVELRALSEISPTFSTDEPKRTPDGTEIAVAPTSPENAEYVVEKPTFGDATDDANPVESESASDFEPEDESDDAPDSDFDEEDADGDESDDDFADVESVDYDEWATVFLGGENGSEKKKSLDADASDDSENSFLDYFDEDDADEENDSDDEEDEEEEEDSDDEEDEEEDVDDEDEEEFDDEADDDSDESEN